MDQRRTTQPNSSLKPKETILLSSALRALKMQIRNVLSSDIESIIKIHCKAFHGFFLTRMGASFLRAYYQTVMDF